MPSSRAVVGGLDTYYTKPEIAEICVRQLAAVCNLRGKHIIEPSAGEGGFLPYLNSLGSSLTAFDIEPQGEGIEQQDFLTFDGWHPGTVVVGNPPFGFASKTAVKFFNHAAGGAEAIGFILPKTFNKVSVVNSLNPYFHRLSNDDLPRNSFVLPDGTNCNVPTCFQVWERRSRRRYTRRIPDVTAIIRYVARQADADISVRRVGWRAGQLLPDGITYSPSTTYFIKSLTCLQTLIEAWQQINWHPIRTATVGVRSVAKSEIALQLGRIGLCA